MLDFANQTVQRILAIDHPSRSDDRRLILEVWRELGLVLTAEQRVKFLNMPSPETIRRTRQKLQEAGKFLPPKPVQEARAQLSDQVRHEIVQPRLL